jgi:hypothetical protein
MEMLIVIPSNCCGNQNNQSGNLVKHTWLFFHNASYSTYDIPSKMVWTKFMNVCMLTNWSIKRSIRITTTSHLRVGIKWRPETCFNQWFLVISSSQQCFSFHMCIFIITFIYCYTNHQLSSNFQNLTSHPANHQVTLAEKQCLWQWTISNTTV